MRSGSQSRQPLPAESRSIDGVDSTESSQSTDKDPRDFSLAQDSGCVDEYEPPTPPGPERARTTARDQDSAPHDLHDVPGSERGGDDSTPTVVEPPVNHGELSDWAPLPASAR